MAPTIKDPLMTTRIGTFQNDNYNLKDTAEPQHLTYRTILTTVSAGHTDFILIRLTLFLLNGIYKVLPLPTLHTTQWDKKLMKADVEKSE